MISRVLVWLLLATAFGASAQAGDSPRVVTADGAITEIVYRLGLESLLVGVDTTSGYPEQTESLPKIGYLRALPFEGVLALKPDLLITSEQAAPAENLERLARAGVQVEKLPSARTPEAALERIVTVGGLLGEEEKAEVLASELRSKINRIQRASATRGNPPTVLFILAAGNHSVMLAGEGTSASALLDAVGAINAASGIQGYKPANREAILASRPDAIVIAESTPGQFTIGSWPEVERLDAWQSGHRLVADGMMLLGFGPRLPDAMAAVNEVLPVPSNVTANDS
ncbi:ABC transporter substrate-binding protein [Marinobacter sp. EhC06]|uniref:heme/hemin ABC transporter substrate-binding protein n=1 Tax=Marinobacter TaxID=2742 RepID=UPI0007D916F1|nr:MULTISPECIES: ABC transporter substrate-binding protein [unclassified Marinobacter]OAN89862.1 ABC transporter substrate-binding protein [Marinobacter sp. EhC06]OAN93956.1 ABC transporter substrate-binding protein [Marinobacter sp. EhN04]